MSFSETSKRLGSDYPEEAIHEAGLDQKPENFLYALRGTALSELRPHSPAIFPGDEGVSRHDTDEYAHDVPCLPSNE